MPSTKIPNTQLAQAISQYWQSYGDQLNKPPEAFRKWSGNGIKFFRAIGEATYNLLNAIGGAEEILDNSFSRQDLESEFVFAPALAVNLGSFRFCFYPLVSSGPADSKALNEFYSKLDHNLLNFVVIPNRPTPDDCISAASLRLKGINIILAAPDDIDALASHLWTLGEMTQYKYFRVLLQGGVDADAVFTAWQVNTFREQISTRVSPRIPSANKFIKNRQDDPREWITHPKFEKLLKAVSSNSCVFVVGESASGKSTLALNVGLRHEARGSKVLYINIATLTDQQAFDIGYYLFQESLKQNNKLIIILDDLHCRPEIGLRLLSYLKTFSIAASDICVMAICWPHYFEDFREIREDAAVIRIDAADVKNDMISKFGGSLSSKTRNEISEFAGNDLLILRLTLETISEHGLISSYGSLAQQIWIQRSQGLRGDRVTLTRAVLVASLLGQYECYVSEEYLRSRAGITRAQIKELQRSKLLLQKGDRYSLPHRSFARLLTLLLGTQKDIWAWFRSKKGINNAPQFVLDYLEFLDPSEVWKALELITKTEGIKSEVNQSQRDVHFITQSWKKIDTLLQKMYEQQALDPTWGNTISSITFACEALSAVGESEKAQGSIDFIRSLYHLESGLLAVEVDNLSTAKDFAQIRLRMENEEKALSFSCPSTMEMAKNIDIHLMHENWACGLVLCAESALRGNNNEYMQLLAKAVEARIESGGNFYPARVPWITARVLMGLGRAGRTVENNDVVKRAAEWLMRNRTEGGAREASFWTSGTGTWNTSLEVTAMCITALREVGVLSSHPVLIEATEWLLDQRKNWTDIGHELDGVVAIEAYLQMNRPWNEITEQITWLSSWAVGQAIWMYATESSDKTHDQSCRAAQVAAFLVRSMWSILRKDLARLLIALGVFHGDDQASLVSLSSELQATKLVARSTVMPTTAFEWDVALSYASEDHVYVEKVATCLKNKGIKVFFDKFEQVDLWGKDLYTHLDEIYRKKARFCVMFLSEDYVRKIWPSHERRSAQARALEEKQEYLLPVMLDKVDVPGLPPTIGFVDGTTNSPTQVCRMIEKKIRSSSV